MLNLNAAAEELLAKVAETGSHASNERIHLAFLLMQDEVSPAAVTEALRKRIAVLQSLADAIDCGVAACWSPEDAVTL